MIGATGLTEAQLEDVLTETTCRARLDDAGILRALDRVRAGIADRGPQACAAAGRLVDRDEDGEHDPYA